MRRALIVLAVLSSFGCGGASAGRARTHRDPMVGAAMGGSAAAASPGYASPGYAAAPTMVPRGVGPHWSFDGIAGGPVSAMDRDGSCRGYIPAAPQIHFDLPTTTSLVISASSGVDTTMMVLAPDGRIWCNDDTNGLDPQVSDTFAPGHYRVFIGTYSEGNSGSFHAEVGPG